MNTLDPLSITLAWRPFIDPLQVHSTWYLFLVPLSFLIAVVYKAARMRSMERYWHAVLIMTVQIVLGMVALAVSSYIFVMIYVRFIAERMAGG